ncbi:hypothetical protein DV738_g3214, partial [Chaetothyriales sp. CBS 135597]
MAPTDQNDAYSKVFNNNSTWRRSLAEHHPDIFKQLGKGQSPQILWVGCADSRCPETTILGVQPGEIFCHRNIANILTNTDLNSLSVIQYAVQYLKVKHIIVCGHTMCGGIAAALDNKRLGLIDTWLMPLRAIRRENLELLESLNERDRSLKLVELNVRSSVDVLRENPTVIDAIAERKLAVHGLIFDVATGELRELDIDEDESVVKTRKVAFRTDRKGRASAERATHNHAAHTRRAGGVMTCVIESNRTFTLLDCADSGLSISSNVLGIATFAVAVLVTYFAFFQDIRDIPTAADDYSNEIRSMQNQLWAIGDIHGQLASLVADGGIRISDVHLQSRLKQGNGESLKEAHKFLDDYSQAYQSVFTDYFKKHRWFVRIRWLSLQKRVEHFKVRTSVLRERLTLDLLAISVNLNFAMHNEIRARDAQRDMIEDKLDRLLKMVGRISPEGGRGGRGSHQPSFGSPAGFGFSRDGLSVPMLLLHHEKKTQSLVRLNRATHTISRRPIQHAPIASPLAGADVPKVVYVSAKTPLMAAVKRVRKFLVQIERRATQDVRLVERGEREGLRRLAEARDRMVKHEVVVKASGRAMAKAVAVGRWFEDREKEWRVGVEIRGGSSESAQQQGKEVPAMSVLEDGDTTMELLGAAREQSALMASTATTNGTNTDMATTVGESVAWTPSILSGNQSILSGNQSILSTGNVVESAEAATTKSKRRKRSRKRKACTEDVPEQRLRWIKTVERHAHKIKTASMGVDEQKEEREVLESIFPDEITDLSDTSYRLSISLDVPNEAGDDGDPTDPPVILLNVTYPESYPEVAPHLDISSPSNAPKHPFLDVASDKAALLDGLQPSIEESLGMAMIFTLVTTLKEQLWERGLAKETEGEVEGEDGLEAVKALKVS